MTISLTGKVALNANINAEFQLGNAMSIYRGVQYYKPSTATLANFDSTNLNFSEFRGTQDKVTANINISADTQNYTLNTASVPGYVANFSKVYLHVDSGIYVGSSSTGSYAMTITGFASGDLVYLINNGTIIGAGGAGGNSANDAPGNPGNAGGNALKLECSTRIYNNGIIAGGGGGGGANDGGSTYGSCFGGDKFTGQGGGGGAGYTAGSGGSGSPNGSAGTKTAGGGGAGTGGNQGAAGSTSGSGRSGGAAGKYITGSAFATWVVTGTRLGGSS